MVMCRVPEIEDVLSLVTAVTLSACPVQFILPLKKKKKKTWTSFDFLPPSFAN